MGKNQTGSDQIHKGWLWLPDTSGHILQQALSGFFRSSKLQPDDFVCATGISHTVRELCDYAFTELDLDYTQYVRLHEKFLRPEELTFLKGDPSKLMKATGWKPEYTFESMITEMVEYWDKLYKIWVY